MKKIYISADLEGLNGVANFKQVLPEYKEYYLPTIIQLHKELNALIKGLKKAGVKDIVVNDAHNTMDNIKLNELDDDITLISGKPKEVSMMYGLDKSFDGVIFFAYHSMATSPSTLSHTFNMDFKKVLINGKLISEAILNGIYASMIGVPIVLATGCDVFCEDIKKEIGNIKTITTKNAISHTAAIFRKNNELLPEYEEIASHINDYPKCSIPVSNNYILEVDLGDNVLTKNLADKLNCKINNTSIIFETNNYRELYIFLQSVSKFVTAQSK